MPPATRHQPAVGRIYVWYSYSRKIVALRILYLISVFRERQNPSELLNKILELMNVSILFKKIWDNSAAMCCFLRNRPVSPNVVR